MMRADLDHGVASRHITLLETLDRVLNRGVVVAGDLTISVADVDLIFVGLRLLLSSVETARGFHLTQEAPGGTRESATKNRQPAVSPSGMI
jgi:hypothetical protein